MKRKPQVPGFSKDEPVFQTSLPDSGRVYDGHHLLHIVGDDAVEQLLVPVLQPHQVDVLVQVVVPAVEVQQDIV